MAYQFSPPSYATGETFAPGMDATARRLFGHFAAHRRGFSVRKVGGAYVQSTDTYSDDIDSADVFYQGGHRYSVSSTEAAALKAAGYDVFLLDETFTDVEPGTSMDGLGGFWHADGIYDPDTSTVGNSVADASFTPYVDAQGRVRTPETTVAGSGGAGYSWGYLDAVPSKVGHEIIFASPTRTRTGLPGAATIISPVESDDPADIALESVHVVTLGYGVGIFLLDESDSEPYQADAIHLFDDFLVADDVTPHVTEVERDGDTVTVLCPDGFELTHEDASVSDLWGSTVLFEQLWGPGYAGAEPMTSRVWAVA